jgi:hypothetical protein
MVPLAPLVLLVQRDSQGPQERALMEHLVPLVLLVLLVQPASKVHLV